MHEQEFATAQALRSMPVMADASRVRRTQRVVRESAMRRQCFKSRLAVVMLGCALVSMLLWVAAIPVWNTMDGWAHAYGIPELQFHMLFLGLWFLPATIVALLLWRGQRKRIEQIARWQQLAQK